ncbi:MAG: tRNA (adenosine(37)-N6)-threonylcarbamoyltransferase complex ATPase subunit type 1 TsaE [Desulfobacterales bacterium]|nr:tRNA (adenosine(37)-N6)-threonylcarbamoyltransferase complex ATPase subunit type 1 TsaE [Desulfobacterales bacterium]MDD4073456.1 tRNA (adenosine(37)-N6)-threonylcarbamoyltransferase complex ATPase subunit type 1 TsaE [Desulfobacterales bacterium]MDD4392098.1 tRNA (adenosine(37)-N6)-threonylcarbamoyltransferase complex ATPase subunit type 1 TsaE [Desulfobacterales bacterium]
MDIAPTKQIQIITRSLDETQALGQKAGSLLKAGTVIALTGDLGSGKTTFVQGLARGLAVADDYYITSPTFTLINEYPGRCPLFHIDLYRLSGPDDFESIGLYDILDSDGVVAIEWAEKLCGDVPSDYVSIDLTILEDDSRQIRITAYGQDAIDLLIQLESAYHVH